MEWREPRGCRKPMATLVATPSLRQERHPCHTTSRKTPHACGHAPHSLNFALGRRRPLPYLHDTSKGIQDAAGCTKGTVWLHTILKVPSTPEGEEQQVEGVERQKIIEDDFRTRIITLSVSLPRTRGE